MRALAQQFKVHGPQSKESLDESLMHVVKRDRGDQVLNLLGKNVCQSSKSPQLHSHSEVLAFNRSVCADALRIGFAESSLGSADWDSCPRAKLPRSPAPSKRQNSHQNRPCDRCISRFWHQ
jgi:hypothetical protein